MTLFDRPACLRKNLATIAYVLICIIVIASMVGSLTQISARALPIGVIAPRLLPSSVGESSIDVAAVSRPRTEDSCKDFGYSFLNPACPTRHKRQVVRGIHHVATLVMGRLYAPQ